MVQRGKNRCQELVDKDGTRCLLGQLDKSVHTAGRPPSVEHALSVLHNCPSMAVAVFDFSENYLCRYQDEVHAVRWGYSQVTVHPVVTYYK
ncbi:hypothetical protein BaRGS_00029938 [Batillaria attramentaria]|uniref:Uncharacterized protein n=1 Tax=Batillaria attramentaria TaxID=370345 RepID=A0ABD0JVT9_9CAEN